MINSYMGNNYDYWQKYLESTIERIQKLIKTKDNIYTDFHIHSDYSSDGTQTLKQIIERAKKNKLDIIAITDHDSIKIYDELYEYLQKETLNDLIIVPGIEFTIDNKEYGSQCHILQLMVNPKEKKLIENVEYNDKAAWNRVRKQFKRISENNTLQFFFEKYHIECNEQKYKEFLNSCRRPIPEYSTLMAYLLKILKEYNITTWDILENLKVDNITDNCIQRKMIKENRYKILEERYKNNAEANYSQRFLHSILAVKGADDDFFPEYKSYGCLSVNNYGELKLNEINENHLTVFAHPNEDKLCIMRLFQNINPNIKGLELNRQNNYKNVSEFYEIIDDLKMFYITGSDSHSFDNNLYDDMAFYKADIKQLKNFIDNVYKYIEIS